jgi:hypothetical protein
MVSHGTCGDIISSSRDHGKAWPRRADGAATASHSAKNNHERIHTHQDIRASERFALRVPCSYSLRMEFAFD